MKQIRATLFIIAVIAFSVPLTTSMAPAPLQRTKIRIFRLYRISPVGFMGAFTVGLGNGAFWSLAPVFALDRFYTRGLACRATMVPRGSAWARMSDHLPLIAELEL